MIEMCVIRRNLKAINTNFMLSFHQNIIQSMMIIYNLTNREAKMYSSISVYNLYCSMVLFRGNIFL